MERKYAIKISITSTMRYIEILEPKIKMSSSREILDWLYSEIDCDMVEMAQHPLLKGYALIIDENGIANNKEPNLHTGISLLFGNVIILKDNPWRGNWRLLTKSEVKNIVKEFEFNFDTYVGSKFETRVQNLPYNDEIKTRILNNRFKIMYLDHNVIDAKNQLKHL